MYSFTGQSQYGSYNSTYATSPAAAVYNATVQSQPTPHTPTLGAAVGATNPTSVYASFSSAAAPTASPYAAYANPTAAAAYAQYGQTAAAVASLQQQQQQQVQQVNYSNLQLQAAAATGVVSASAAAYPGHTATRLTDSYSTVGSVPSTGGTYTSLSEYTNTLRTAAAAAVAASAAANSTSNNSYVGVTRIGTAVTSQPANTSSATGTSNSSIFQKFSTSNYNSYDAAVYAAASSYLQSKAAGAANVWMGATKKSSTTGYDSGSSSFSGITSSNIAITGGSSGGVSGRGGYTGNRGRGTFSNKRFGQGRSADMQQFYCEVCKISCAGAQTYKEHMDGQKHKKKEAMQKGEGQTLSKSRVSFRCETCNVTCTGKDTYESHVRGSKHQKTANLMKKLGKPVAETPTVLAPGEKSNKPGVPSGGTPISTVGGPAVPTKRVIGVPTVKFVGGEKLQSTAQELARKAANAAEAAIEASGQKSAAVEAALAAEKEVQPVGEDYVEEERNASGKLIQYSCKLCDCKFSDPNAKNIHIKGRKHRLQYKMKVNPNLVVEVKPNQVPREMRNEIARKLRAQRMHVMPPRPLGAPQPLLMPLSARPWCGVMDPGRRIETVEDRHVMAKHRSIYPEESQLTTIEKLVSVTEKALKAVSDNLAQEETKKSDNEIKESQGEGIASHSIETQQPDRILKGVMRVGLLAKGLLLKTDREVQLVVLCSQPPTRTLLSKVVRLLPQVIEKGENEVVTVVEKPDESALLLKHSNSDIICRIVLTCVLLREEHAAGEGDGATAAAGAKGAPPKDPLPKVPCLEALAELRHAKWFQVRCSNLQSAAITLRILRDVRQRVQTWQPLKAWMTELLVEKVLSSLGAPLSPGDAVRRVFEAVASGILFSSGPGLIDPCEKQSVDVLAELTGQQREDITSSSQHALRLIAFNQMYKVLAIDRLPDIRNSYGSGNASNNGSGNVLNDRKRPRDSNASLDDGEVVDMKKDKKDDAKGEEKKVA
ncbi:DZF family protein [Brugia malayi]|uniref:DZF family protein n=1 Tax=Brugia malayi TaxID=6279 RepID=A0A4E9FG77_BRUMA|nr:DZF family protein [Brugia malayi]VIO95229.1 DZF family protein [Brugia malayi]